MENVDSFISFLERKKNEGEENKVDWNQRKIKWLDSINQLYDDIKNWLKPFEEKSLVAIRTDKELVLTEEYIGNYTTNRLDVYLGNDIVSLIPKGSLVIGSLGRIDMIGSKGEVMLIQPEWGKWVFARRSQKIETWDVTAESFKEMLQQLV